MKRFLSKLSLALGAALAVPGVALAQFVPTEIPVADALSQIGEIGTAVIAIGGGLLLAAAVAVAVKWAKAAIFG